MRRYSNDRTGTGNREAVCAEPCVVCRASRAGSCEARASRQRCWQRFFEFITVNVSRARNRKELERCRLTVDIRVMHFQDQATDNSSNSGTPASQEQRPELPSWGWAWAWAGIGVLFVQLANCCTYTRQNRHGNRARNS